MAWQREYKGPGTTFLALFFGGVFLFIGIIFTLLLGWLGLVLLVSGLVLPVAILWLSTDVTITCSDQGFAVRRSSRRSGVSETAYGWHEVTATHYYERRAGRNGRIQGHFVVDTARGRAFDVSDQTRGFRDMIDVFNAMTRPRQ